MTLATIPSMRHLDMAFRLRHLAEIGFSPPIIADVGAGSGDWARMVARIWPESEIYGFEPNAHETPRLDRATRELPRFQYRNVMLGPGARDQVRYFEAGHQTTVLAQPDETDDCAIAPMLTLDGVVREGWMPAPTFIKLDVQGFELEVLKGAEESLQKCEAVLTEVSFFSFHPQVPTVDRVIAFLKERGFAWYDTLGMIRRSQDDAIGQMDLLFLQEDHPLRRSNQAW